LEPAKLAALYQEFIAENPMVSIEDPFDQDDWAAWTDLTANTSIQVFIIDS
jgi:enolase